MPEAAQAAFAALPGKLRSVQADVRDPHALELLLSTAKVEAALAGAAITSSPDRERAEPAAIFEVNLAAPLQLVALAARHGVRRVVLLSSAAAMGDRLFGERPVREEDASAPATLYGIGKAALEAAAVRWAGLANAGPEVVVARLSAVFGPWERATGVRDRLSPPHAIACAAVRREPIAPLPRAEAGTGCTRPSPARRSPGCSPHRGSSIGSTTWVRASPGTRASCCVPSPGSTSPSPRTAADGAWTSTTICRGSARSSTRNASPASSRRRRRPEPRPSPSRAGSGSIRNGSGRSRPRAASR